MENTVSILVLLDDAAARRRLRDLEKTGNKGIDYRVKVNDRAILETRQSLDKLTAAAAKEVTLDISANASALIGAAKDIEAVTKALSASASQIKSSLDSLPKGLDRVLSGIPVTIDSQKLIQSVSQSTAKGITQAMSQGYTLANIEAPKLFQGIDFSPIQKGLSQSLKSAFQLDLSDLRDSLSETLESSFAGLKTGGGNILGNFLSNSILSFQQGIGQGLGFQYSKGIEEALSESGIQLDQLGKRAAQTFRKIGVSVGDRLLDNLGIEEGLAGIPSEIAKIQNFFNEIIDEKEISRKISVLELQLGSLVDSITQAQDLSAIRKNVEGVVSSARDIAVNEPLQGIERRRQRILRDEALPQVIQRSEEIDTSGLNIPKNANSVVFGIGGFAGTQGKSADSVAQRLQLLTGEQNPVIPVANPNTDINTSFGENTVKYFFEGIKRIIDANITTGYNLDSVEAAAQALAVQRDTGLPVSFAGYSAGGFVAKDAATLVNLSGSQATAVGIGTPRIGGAAFEDESYRAVLGENDPLSKINSAGKEVFSKGGTAHKLAEYLGQVDTQIAILKQLGIKIQDAPELKSPTTFDIPGLSEDISGLLEDVAATLGDNNQATLFKKTGAFEAVFLSQISTYRDSIREKISSSVGVTQEFLEAADEELANAERAIKAVVGSLEAVADPVKGPKLQDVEIADPWEDVSSFNPVDAQPQLASKVLERSDVEKYNVEILREVNRILGQSTKGRKEDLVERILELDIKDFRKALKTIEPYIETGPRGGQSLNLPQESDVSPKLKRARDAEKRLRDALLVFQNASEDRREQISRIAIQEIDRTQNALLELEKKSQDPQIRRASGSARGRLEGLRRNFTGETPIADPTSLQTAIQENGETVEKAAQRLDIPSLLASVPDFSLDAERTIQEIIATVAGIPGEALKAAAKETEDSIPTPAEVAKEVQSAIANSPDQFAGKVDLVSPERASVDLDRVSRKARNQVRKDQDISFTTTESVVAPDQQRQLTKDQVALRRTAQQIIELVRRNNFTEDQSGDILGLLGGNAGLPGKGELAKKEATLGQQNQLKRLQQSLIERAQNLGLSPDDVKQVLEQIAAGETPEGLIPGELLPREQIEVVRTNAKAAVQKILEETLRAAKQELKDLPEIVAADEGPARIENGQFFVPRQTLDRIETLGVDRDGLSKDVARDLASVVDRDILQADAETKANQVNAERIANRGLNVDAVVVQILEAAADAAGLRLAELPEIARTQALRASVSDGVLNIPEDIANRIASGNIEAADIEAITRAAGIAPTARIRPEVLEQGQGSLGALSRLPQVRAADIERATISADGATIEVPQATFERIQAGNLQVADVEDIARATRERSRQDDLLRFTPSEIDRFGPRVEQQVSTVSDRRQRETARATEADAIAFASRIAPDVREQVLRREAVSQFEDSVGIGGARAGIAVGASQVEALERLRESAEQFGIDLSKEVSESQQSIELASKRIESAITEARNLEILPADAILQLQDDIVAQVSSIQEAFSRIESSFLQQAVDKPQQVRDELEAELNTFNRKREIEPLAQRFGIETQGQSRRQIASALVSSANLQELEPAVRNISAQRAERRQQRVDTAKAVVTAPVRAERFVANTTQDAIAQTKRAIDTVSDGFLRLKDAVEDVRGVRELTGAINTLTAASLEAYGRLAQAERNFANQFGVTGKAALFLKDNVVAPLALTSGAKALPAVGGAIEAGLGFTDAAVSGAVGAGFDAAGFGVTEAFSPTQFVPAEASGGFFSQITTGIENQVGRLTNSVDNFAGAAESFAKSVLNPAETGELVTREFAEKAVKGATVDAEVGIVKNQVDRAAARQISVADVSGKTAGEVTRSLTSKEAGIEARRIRDAVEKDLATLKGQLSEARKSGRTAKVEEAELRALVGRIDQAEKVINSIIESLGADLKGNDRRSVEAVKGRLDNRRTQARKQIGVAQSITDKAAQAGANTTEGFAAGIEERSAAPEDAIELIAEETIQALKDKLGIQSPAKAMIPPGRDTVRGLVVGIEQEAPKAKAALENVFDELTLDTSNPSQSFFSPSATSRPFEPGLPTQKSKVESLATSYSDDFTGVNPQIALEASINASSFSDAAEKAQDLIDDQKLEADIDVDERPTTLFGRIANAVKGAGQKLGEFEQKARNISPVFGDLIDAAKLSVAAFIGFEVLQEVGRRLVEFTRTSLDAALSLERLKTSLNFSFGSSIGGASALETIREEAERLNIPLAAAREGFKSLSAATRNTSLEGAATEDVFSGLNSAVATLGLDAETAGRAFTAVEQIASKGKLSAEELRQQLSEAIPGAFQIGARALNISEAELNKRLELGQVTSEEFFPRFGQQLQQEFGPGAEDAAKNAQGAVNEFNNAVLTAQESFGQLLQPAQVAVLNVASDAIKLITENIELLGPAALTVSAIIANSLLSSRGGLYGLLDAGLQKGIAFASDSIKSLGKNIKGLAFQDVTKGAQSAATSIQSFGKSLLKVAAPFLGILALVESFKTIGSVFSGSFGTSELAKGFEKTADRIESAVKSIKDSTNGLGDAIAKDIEPPRKAGGFDLTLGLGGILGLEDGFRTDNLLRAENRQRESGTVGRIVSNLNPFRSLTRQVPRLFGGTPGSTVADLEFTREIEQGVRAAGASQDLLLTTREQSPQFRRELERTRGIDEQIQRLTNRRSALQSETIVDKNAVAEIDLQLREIQQSRRDSTQGVNSRSAQAQQTFRDAEAQLDAIQKQLERGELSNTEAATLTQYFEGVRDNAQETVDLIRDLEREVGGVADPVSRLLLAFEKINLELAKSRELSEDAFNESRLASAIQQTEGFSTNRNAQQDAAIVEARGRLQQARTNLSAQETFVRGAGQEISRPEVQEILGNVRTPEGQEVSLQSPLAALERTEASLSESQNSREKAILNEVIVFKQAQREIVSLRAEAVSAEGALQQAAEAERVKTINDGIAQRQAAIDSAIAEEQSTINQQLQAREISESQAQIQLARIAVEGSKAKIAIAQDELQQIQAAGGQGLISAETLAQKELELTSRIDAAKEELARNELQREQAKREAILETLDLANQRASAEITISQTTRETTIQEGIASGLLTQEDAAIASTRSDQEATQQRLADAERRLREERRLEAEGVRSRRESAIEQINIQQEIAQINRELIGNEIQLQANLRDAIDATLSKRREELNLLDQQGARDQSAGVLAVRSSSTPFDQDAFNLNQETQTLTRQLGRQNSDVALIEEAIAALDNLEQKDEATQRKRIQLQSELADAQRQAIETQTALIENAQQKQILAIERTVSAQRRASEQANRSIDKQVAKGQALLQLLDNQSKLLSAQQQLNDAISGAESAGLQIQDSRLTDKIADAQKEGDEKEVAKLEKERLKLAIQIADQKIKAEERSFALAKQQLDLELKREKVAARIALLEAQKGQNVALQGVNEARGQLSQAEARGDSEQIAQAQANLEISRQDVEISALQVELAKENLGVLDEIANVRRRTLDIQAGTATSLASSEKESAIATARREGVSGAKGGRLTRGTTSISTSGNVTRRTTSTRSRASEDAAGSNDANASAVEAKLEALINRSIPELQTGFDATKTSTEAFSGSVGIAESIVSSFGSSLETLGSDFLSLGRSVKNAISQISAIAGAANRYTGGPVAPGQTYWIAEHGPEILDYGLGDRRLFTEKQLVTAEKAGFVHTAAQTERIRRNSAMATVSGLAQINIPANLSPIPLPQLPSFNYSDSGMGQNAALSQMRHNAQINELKQLTNSLRKALVDSRPIHIHGKPDENPVALYAKFRHEQLRRLI